MSTLKNVSFLISGFALLTLASCGNSHDSSSTRGPKACSEIDCLTSVNWKIQLQGRSFPEKARVDINGTTVIDECVPKQKFTINRAAEPQSVSLENFWVPKKGQLKIDVIDLGHCDSESLLISDDKVDFDIVKAEGTTEIHIDL